MDGTEGLPLDAPGYNGVKRPRQNRVTPFGTIEATHHRGSLMGNRGDLHAPDGSLGKQWRSRRWISCLLDTGDSWKAPMDAPGHYYPLFFHDEAVALAAGHRPCGECRPDALAAFIAAWKKGHGYKPSDWVPLREIDGQLHHARLAEMHRRRRVDIASLPNGVFVWCPTFDSRPLLKIDGELCPWSHAGYEASAPISTDGCSTYLLTPTMIVQALAAGYSVSQPKILQLVATAEPIDPHPLSA